MDADKIICYKCAVTLPFKRFDKPGRRETCQSCGSDIRVCLNCAHYDLKAYNQCHENQAERVLDKDKGNYCDFFTFSTSGTKSSSSKQDVKSKLDSLFK